MSAKNANSAYSFYRSALKAQRGGRAGSRKQSALKIASDRYSIPIGELKSIIRVMDAERGITHEHTEPYLRLLEFYAEVERIENQHSGSCPQCNGAREDAELSIQYPDFQDVRVRVNPAVARTEHRLEPVLSCFGYYLAIKNAD